VNDRNPIILKDLSGINQSRRPLAEARHAPGFIYTSPEVLEAEKDRIFMHDWLCAGREEEIPNKGDYMTMRFVNEPVLIVRGEGGEINALSNVCAHRGVEIATGSGNKKAFSCPFHGWTYNLNGTLVGAPHMRDLPNFEASSVQLPRLQLARWRGWIFVNFDDNAAPFSEYVAEFDKDFGYLRQEDCRLAVKSEVEIDCNWKLIVENLIDFYHLNVIHRTTNGRSFSKWELTPRSRGGYVAFYNCGPSTFDQKPVFGKAPWLEDKPDDFSTAGLLAPNFTFFGRVDTVHPCVTWPLGVNKSKTVVYTLLPEVYFNQPNFQERASIYGAYMKKILSEDVAMLDSLQNGLASRRFSPGRMAPLEPGCHQIIKGYLDRMFPAA
jgi:Rieske 2Fe-2S family protein